MITDTLLARYFGGVATESELLELNAWIAESAENEAEFLKMTKLFELTGHSGVNVPGFNKVHAQAAFESYMHKSKSVRKIKFVPKISTKWILSIAAVAAIALVTSVFWQYFINDTVLVEANNSTVELTLPDNTLVRLSENSTLQYARSMENDIVLNGNARFEVAEKGQTKLRVKAGDTFIEDIGTIFEVSARDKNGFIEVKVSEGLVKFYSSSNKGITIAANETGIYNKKTKTFEIAARCERKNGLSGVMLKLDAMSLLRASEIIENAYGITVHVAENIQDKQITVQFLNEQPQTVLHIIAQTLGLNVKVKGVEYYLSVK